MQKSDLLFRGDYSAINLRFCADPSHCIMMCSPAMPDSPPPACAGIAFPLESAGPERIDSAEVVGSAAGFLTAWPECDDHTGVCLAGLGSIRPDPGTKLCLGSSECGSRGLGTGFSSCWRSRRDCRLRRAGAHGVECQGQKAVCVSWSIWTTDCLGDAWCQELASSVWSCRTLPGPQVTLATIMQAPGM